MYAIYHLYDYIYIREQITPKGDGNIHSSFYHKMLGKYIREQITPKGDGNIPHNYHYLVDYIIREQITQKGDGNNKEYALITCVQND